MTYAEALIRKGKRGAAIYVQAECSSNAGESSNPQHLNALLDHLLHPDKNINDKDTIEWCQSLIGGGKTYEDFTRSVKQYDSTAKCGLVWTADFMAYRCRTCGISQCMSLCAECFKDGNHEGHDFNMFRSRAGGACDCGDFSVMKGSGFCSRHHGSSRPANPPADLLCVAEKLMPRIVLRLVQHLRVNTVPSSDAVQMSASTALQKYETVIRNADKFLKLLHDLSSLGAAMRSVMTKCLIDQQSYEKLTDPSESDNYEYNDFMRRSQRCYEDALANLPNPDPPVELQDCPALTAQLQHKTFLEELVFWTVKYEFPEKLVCLLLKMLPDTEYKEAFTRSFVLHYSRVSMMLVRSSNSDKLSNRIVHVSVQLFSNEDLALAMTEQLSLLHIMVSSLKNMMNNVLIPSGLQTQGTQRQHEVVDCSQHVMKLHCYWPLVSDLNNVLSHPPIAFKFMADNTLLTMWFDFLKTFQGMNLNQRIIGQHIEFEPNTYCASFSGELEASASPMWALVKHLKYATVTREYTAKVITHCLRAIQEWMEAIAFKYPEQIDPRKVSFHLPLHRYFSVFLRQAVKYQGFTLKELLPHPYMLSLLMMHPLRVQTAFYEIMSGLWVRNGLQIKGQAMTYIQCHFCKSMVDADLFLLQVCATQLPANTVLKTIIDSFQITDWLSLSPGPRRPGSRIYRDQEQELQMIGACLVFLISVLALGTNLGLDEEQLTRLEMVSLLCMGDRTHSALHEHIPEKYNSSVSLELFDSVLSDVAVYSEPRFEAGGNMQQGMYLPKPHVWEHLYDPIYVLLRAVHRREFQTSIERYNQFANSQFANGFNLRKSVLSPWPPWRLPSDCDSGFEDPRKMLHSKYAHGLIFNLLYKAVHGSLINDLVTSLSVHLLELALTYPQNQTPVSGTEVALPAPQGEPMDLHYDTWFQTDCLSSNLRQTIGTVLTRQILYDGSPDVEQSMEIDQVSDISDTDAGPFEVNPPPGGRATAPGGPVRARINPSLPYYQPLAITGPSNPTTAVAEEAMDHEGALMAFVGGGGESSSKSVPYGSGKSLKRPPTKRGVIAIDESTVTLLLQLHSRYSGRADSYVPLADRTGYTVTDEYRESRVGDACFFIEKVLDKIGLLDEACAQAITDARKALWPHYFMQKAERDLDSERVEMAAKQRRAKAKEHQRKVMEQLAQQRKRFMDNLETSGIRMEDIEQPSQPQQPHQPQQEVSEEPYYNRKGLIDMEQWKKQKEQPCARRPPEFTCCHCLLQESASEDKPLGLVTLVQSTSVLAHRHTSHRHLVLPTSPEEEEALAEALQRSSGRENELLHEQFSSTFSSAMASLSLTKGVKGGVHIQSCGHHMHYDCRQSYCETLKQQGRVSRDQPLDTERGEFTCPVCRQMGNSLLPIPPDEAGLPVTLFPNNEHERTMAISRSISELLKSDAVDVASGLNTPLRLEMNKLVDFVTKTSSNVQEGPEAKMNMLYSIARTNLELDVVHRGGDLVQALPTAPAAASSVTSSSSSTNKTKFCFAPLMHLLSIHIKLTAPKSANEGWGGLTGSAYQQDPSMKKTNRVPLLMQDPLTVMIHFVLMLPFNVDVAYFITIAKACYNLTLTQTLVRMTSHSMTKKQRDQLQSMPTDKNNFTGYLHQIVNYVESTTFYQADHEDAKLPKDLNFEVLEEEAKCQMLPFLRIAALIKHYMFHQPLPAVTDPKLEFKLLAEYLELVPVARDGEDAEMASVSCESDTLSVVDGFNWFLTASRMPKDCPISEMDHWLKEYHALSLKHPVAARKALNVRVTWKLPSMLRVPKSFDQMFQYYHKRKCKKCERVPKDPTVCLMCGTFLCMKETCCRDDVSGLCETVHHANTCGGGTGIFLCINSSTILVIRGKRACIWGSFYLDVFGEEDRDLKRGKPLYLHPERFQLLEHQWLTHKFDHTSRRWVFHRDTL